MKKEPAPVVVLLSGGMDSSTLLHRVAAEHSPGLIHALSFDYGQRHKKELEAARWQAQATGVAAHRTIDCAFLGPLLCAGSSLLEGGAPVPDLASLTPAELHQPPTYVPNRNMILLSLAAAFAEVCGARQVFYGAQAQDEYGYWDCTADFLTQINAVLALNRGETVRIEAPYLDYDKAAILQEGLRLGVDYCHTWTCYRGGAVACGTCPTCVERRNAFDRCGVTDPLPYAPHEA